MKKANLKQTKEIDALKKEAKRKDLVAKRKQEEIKVLQTQKNMVAGKKQNASKMRQAAQDIDKDQIKEWIRSSVDKMIEIADAEAEIRNQQKQINAV